MRKRPWLWIVFAFLLLVAAWGVLIKIALNNPVEPVPLEKGAVAHGD